MSEEVTQDEMDRDEEMLNEAEDRADINMDAAEGYGAPMQEEKINQFTITKEAIHSKDAVRTTFLKREELGLPLFSVRFYLGCQSIAESFNAQMIADYFKSHVQNISSSGMSNEGFIMKLNVTNRRDVTRRHERRVEGIKENEAP